MSLLVRRIVCRLRERCTAKVLCSPNGGTQGDAGDPITLGAWSDKARSGVKALGESGLAPLRVTSLRTLDR